MRQYARHSHAIWRSSKPSVYKYLARDVLEQAMEDIQGIGLPVCERDRWKKDAIAWFEERGYELFCLMAEISISDMEQWYESIDKNGESVTV